MQLKHRQERVDSEMIDFRLEHPNPQFKRDEWVNLNGEWDFAYDFGCSGRERGNISDKAFPLKINVPYCPESALSGINNKDFMNCVWYRRKFTVSDEYKSKRCILHFGAVDYKAFVYINEKLAIVHEGGYTPFECDITNCIESGENIITVCAEDNNRSGKQPSGKQSRQYGSYGCYYTRTTGIWQTVWLEFVEKEYIEYVKYYPDSENGTVLIEARLHGKQTLEAEVFYEGRSVGKASAAGIGGTAFVQIALSELHLWEVGCGRLYDVLLRYGKDCVSSYFGLRNVEIDGMKFLLNGKSVFQRLVLDQGFYPDGIYTAPSAAALENDIKLSLDAGFNGARLHEKVFEPLFLYYCDKYGYIVWGEYPNWGYDHTKPDNGLIYINEWREAVRRDFNHPSIVLWCPFNETWDLNGRQQCDDILKAVYLETKALDPTRPCIDTSGNFHTVTDVYDLHDYEQNPEEFKKRYGEFKRSSNEENAYEIHETHPQRQHYNGKAFCMSEYGGIKWAADKENKSWGYGNAPESEEEFIARYKGLTDVLLNNENIFGFCYTQLYDVEQETNGLYTYDRKAKFDMKIFKKINSRKAKIEHK